MYFNPLKHNGYYIYNCFNIKKNQVGSCSGNALDL
jgi:hypothetical protein